MRLFSAAGWLATALVAAGCNSNSGDYKPLSDKDARETPPVTGHHHHHEHGPHGGHIIELGDHHGEVVLESDRKLTLYVLDGDAKKTVAVADASAVANLKLGEETSSVTLVSLPLTGEADGASSRFQSEQPLPDSIKDLEDVHGSVTLTIAGAAQTGEIEHDHDHDH
ncbi:MAG: hypothetical protein KF774_10175 [Planctomyces sp.]|nr:hypothetical protein [Planctomyces sp.]